MKIQHLHTPVVNAKRIKTLTGRKLSVEHREHVSQSRIGMKFTEQHRLNMSLSRKNQIPWNKGKKLSIEHRKKLIEARAKRIIPCKDTKIERIVAHFLETNGVQFVAHKSFKLRDSYHRVDIYIPSMNLAIECDGQYWHSIPKMQRRDRIVNTELLHHCDLIRLPERDILNETFKSTLKSIIRNPV